MKQVNLINKSVESNPEYAFKVRHSTSHVLAMAILRLYPETKLGIGVVEDEGFFHDFEINHPITNDDLSAIEAEMLNIIEEKLPFTQVYLPQEIALNTLLQRGQIYKAELLNDTNDSEISFFKTGSEFIDLCRGPHILNTAELGHFHLTAISGAYWKGDEDRPQLLRIHGIAFATKTDLEAHLERQQRLKEVDFKRLGSELDYFIIDDQEFVYTEAGSQIKQALRWELYRAMDQLQFNSIEKPFLTSKDKHPLDIIFHSKNRSYRELPFRWYMFSFLASEAGYEIKGKSIQMVEQLKVFSITNEHSYQSALKEMIKLTIEMLQNLKLQVKVEISTPDQENDFLQSCSQILEETKALTHCGSKS